jgi:hypothetical protein
MGEGESAKRNDDGEYNVFHFESPRDLRFGRPAVAQTALWQQTFRFFFAAIPKEADCWETSRCFAIPRAQRH